MTAAFLTRHVTLSLSALAVLWMIGCGGPKPAVDAQSNAAATPAEEAKPAMTEEQAKDLLADAQKDAVKVEDENHELRRQIFEAKTKLGREVDTGIPETDTPKAAEPAKPATAAKAADAPKKDAAPAKKKKK